jgi:hypothetical protein
MQLFKSVYVPQLGGFKFPSKTGSQLLAEQVEPFQDAAKWGHTESAWVTLPVLKAPVH